jgi:K+-transporting ATPase c subunit
MLAPANKDNMADVYAEFWRMQEIAASVEPAINLLVSNLSSMDAEVSETNTAHWYLVECYPGDDLKALRWLARRKFGVFRPMVQRRQRGSEMRLQGWQPAFPGWLLVYVWDIKKMLRRILAQPGVMRVLSHQVSGQPQPVEERYFVERLQAQSWDYNDNAPHARHQGHYAVEGERHIRRQKKRRQRPGKRIKKARSPQPSLTESLSGVTQAALSP